MRDRVQTFWVCCVIFISIFLQSFVTSAHVTSRAEKLLLREPASGAVLNDCPKFSWEVFDESSFPCNFSVLDENMSVVYSVTTNESSFDFFSLGVEHFLDVGSYTWEVTTHEGDRTQSQFRVASQSCLPPKIDNYVNNTFSSFRQYSDDAYPWKLKDNETLRIGTENIMFYPFNENEKIYSMTELENWNIHGGSVTHAASVASEFVNVTDNVILSFRYVFYTNGPSTICVTLKDNSMNVLAESCLEQSSNISLMDGKWDLFKMVLPRHNTTKITLQIEYRRGSSPQGLDRSTLAFFMSELHFGPCSGLNMDYYDSGTTTSDLNEECPYCSSARMRIPKAYESRCQSCSKLKDLEECSSIDYCTPCRSQNRCDDSPGSDCRADSDKSNEEYSDFGAGVRVELDFETRSVVLVDVDSIIDTLSVMCGKTKEDFAVDRVDTDEDGYVIRVLLVVKDDDTARRVVDAVNGRMCD